MDPDQTAPIGAVCSGSTLFASLLKFDNNVWQLFAADDFSRQHFQMHFFLTLKGLITGIIQVNWIKLGRSVVHENIQHDKDYESDYYSRTLCRRQSKTVVRVD